MDNGLDALREALRALNSVENRDSLPPAISLATSAALTKMLSALRTFQQQIEICARSYGGPERRAKNVGNHEFDSPRRRSDDTQDAWNRLEDALEDTRQGQRFQK